MGQTALLREAVIVYFNRRQTPAKVSAPPFQGRLPVVAAGCSVFTPRPKRGSEPHNNAEWIRIKIEALALVSYYAVCTVFAVGRSFFSLFFKCRDVLQCTKGAMLPHKICDVKK